MSGIKREDARRALDAGWGQDNVFLIHKLAQEQDVIVKYIPDFAFYVDGDFLIYDHHTLREIEVIFNDTGLRLGTQVVAYADGSGNTDTKPAGIGVYVEVPGESPLYIAENIGNGTNNRAELCAIWRAARAVPSTCQNIIIRSDSEYAIGALTKDWARNKNADLIATIRRDLEIRGKAVELKHIYGHAGHQGNEIADKLANIGRKFVTLVSRYPTT
jgi:ribonuclease HI